MAAKVIELTEEDAEALYYSVSCRLGFIETGRVSMRASDAVRSGRAREVKILSLDQKKLVVQLEELMLRLL